MNMQALMKQAQAMQRDITKAKAEIDNMQFEGESSLVKVMVNGKKDVLKVAIATDALDMEKDDISLLEDMVMLAINDAFKKVDKTTEEKMGKYSSMMNGLM